MNKENKNSVAFSVNIRLNFKIIVVGNRHAGKTSLIMRFVKDIFELSYKVTVGVQFFSKIVQHSDEEFAIQIWDTAGGQNYKSVVRSFYNFAHCVMIVYDRESDLQTNIDNWMKEIKEYTMQSARLVLVRTKMDLNPVGQVEQDKVNHILQKYGIDFFMPVSSKKNQNVSELFTKIAVNLHDQYQTNEDFRRIVEKKNQSILLASTPSSSTSMKKKNCCHN